MLSDSISTYSIISIDSTCSLILSLVYFHRQLEKYKVNQVSLCTSAFKTCISSFLLAPAHGDMASYLRQISLGCHADTISCISYFQ